MLSIIWKALSSHFFKGASLALLALLCFALYYFWQDSKAQYEAKIKELELQVAQVQLAATAWRQEAEELAKRVYSTANTLKLCLDREEKQATNYSNIKTLLKEYEEKSKQNTAEKLKNQKALCSGHEDILAHLNADFTSLFNKQRHNATAPQKDKKP